MPSESLKGQFWFHAVGELSQLGRVCGLAPPWASLPSNIDQSRFSENRVDGSGGGQGHATRSVDDVGRCVAEYGLRGAYGPQGSTGPPSESGGACPTRHRLARLSGHLTASLLNGVGIVIGATCVPVSRLGCSSAPPTPPAASRARACAPTRRPVLRERPALLDPFVLGSSRLVFGVPRHHGEHGFALVFGKTRRPRRSRRTISQLAVLKIELTLGQRATRG